MRKISLGMLPLLLLCSTPVLAQGMGGGMEGMGGGGMGGGGMGHGHRGGGMGEGGGEMRRPNPPKPISRERFDKVVAAMFREADVNRDGMVTLEELRGIIEARRDTIIRARFDKVDSNHNGMISQEEFFAWQRQMGSVASSDTGGMGEHEGPVAEVIMPQPGNDPADRALTALIEPLSVTLVTQANSNYDAGLSLEELLAYEGKRFDAADTNHDGWLTIDEIRAASPHRRRMPGGDEPHCPSDAAC